MSLAVAILAAGASSRFGSCKLLAQANGQTLLQRCIDTCMALQADKLVVITGAWHREMLTALPAHKDRFVYNSGWQNGMSTSLKLACEQCAQAEKMLIALPDQAMLTQKHYQQLIDASVSIDDSIVCAQYAQVLGVPAIFPKRFYPELNKLKGDQGARKLLNKAANCHAITMPEAEFDVDTEEDLLRLKNADRRSK